MSLKPLLKATEALRFLGRLVHRVDHNNETRLRQRILIWLKGTKGSTRVRSHQKRDLDHEDIYKTHMRTLKSILKRTRNEYRAVKTGAMSTCFLDVLIFFCAETRTSSGARAPPTGQEGALSFYGGRQRLLRRPWLYVGISYFFECRKKDTGASQASEARQHQEKRLPSRKVLVGLKWKSKK